MLFLKRDLAKYPFTREAADYVKQYGLKIDDLANQDYAKIVDRAEERIRESIFKGIVDWKEEANYDVEKANIEILSFPVSLIFVMSMDDEFLNRRYSLAESKRTYMLLKDEVNKEALTDIARGTFNWDVKKISETIDQTYDFTLSVVDFLREAPYFHDEKWKLVNRILVKGHVYLKADELARLIAEEARNRVQERLSERQRIKLPVQLDERIRRLSQVLDRNIRKIKLEITPEVNPEAYPPCIKELYSSLLSGKQISHIGRFTLTAFLLNIGMDMNDVINRYTTASDFNEQLTRYQVEHIAGKRGGGVKYTSPNCDTLQTHGLCSGKNELCKRVKHPLTYYFRKRRQEKAKGEKNE